ncbi:MAG: ACR protein [Chloroflexota bacterium]
MPDRREAPGVFCACRGVVVHRRITAFVGRAVAPAVSPGARFLASVCIMNLHNDTAVNVAALLKGPVGATRAYPLHLDSFALDTDWTATGVAGDVKLTRLSDAVLAAIHVEGSTELQCLRCLRIYEQAFTVSFTEEFRIAYDVRTGNGIVASAGDERFTISPNHELDFGEVLRQEIIIALPMRPTCGEACPGPDVTEVGATDDEPADARFAALSHLLEEFAGEEQHATDD